MLKSERNKGGRDRLAGGLGGTGHRVSGEDLSEEAGKKEAGWVGGENG